MTPPPVLSDHREQLPEDLASRQPSAAEVAIVSDIVSDKAHDWGEQAVRASALTGMPLSDLVGNVLPLLEFCGEPTAELVRLRAAWSDAITFDDLLLLGCLQTWPALSGQEVDGVCRPSCRRPDELADRITRWARPGPDQTGRPIARREPQAGSGARPGAERPR